MDLEPQMMRVDKYPTWSLPRIESTRPPTGEKKPMADGMATLNAEQKLKRQNSRYRQALQKISARPMAPVAYKLAEEALKEALKDE